MEYLLFVGVIGLFMIILAIKGFFDDKKNAVQYKKKCNDEYGKDVKREYTTLEFETIAKYFEHNKKEDSIDDITWNDFDMDEIYKKINFTKCSIGDEYLYYLLRNPKKKTQELEELEKLISYMENNEDIRIELQHIFHKIGRLSKYSLSEYLDNLLELKKEKNIKHFCIDVSLFLCILLLFVEFQQGFIMLFFILLYSIASYFKDKGKINPYLSSFTHIIKMVKAMEALNKYELERKQPKKDVLLPLLKKSYFIGNQTSSSGSPLSIIWDYMCMIFHIDLIVFNQMMALVEKEKDYIWEVFEYIGLIDSCISISCLRSSLEEYCIPTFRDDLSIEITNGYHPLIKKPVKNSIYTKKSILLTGSNASGKSTFLKMVGINALCAQSIHTCLAKSYKGCICAIYSSMSLKDNIRKKESYFLVEIKAIKRIIDKTFDKTLPVLCFIDEVLRGTNTIERIAASSYILETMAYENLLCFAATHDIELTTLLENIYSNYHFEERIVEDDILFSYELLEGKATTRNAIDLLKAMGYQTEIVEKAKNRATNFLEHGIWK